MPCIWSGMIPLRLAGGAIAVGRSSQSRRNDALRCYRPCPAPKKRIAPKPRDGKVFAFHGERESAKMRIGNCPAAVVIDPAIRDQLAK